MNRIIFWLNILLFTTLTCLAEQNPVDSLKNLVSKAADDTTKVNLLIELSGQHLYTIPNRH
jgi:hypothetical protein